MSLLSGIGNFLRRAVDDVGSVFSGGNSPPAPNNPQVNPTPSSLSVSQPTTLPHIITPPPTFGNIQVGNTSVGPSGTNQPNQGAYQPTPLPDAIHNAKFGVLANNPQAQQALLNDSQPAHFNPVTAGLSSGLSALNQTLVKPVTALPSAAIIDPFKETVALATGNKQAERNAGNAISTDFAQSLPGITARAGLQFGASIPVGNYQNRTVKLPGNLGQAVGGPIPTYQTQLNQDIQAGKNPAVALAEQIPNVAGGALTFLGGEKAAEAGNRTPLNEDGFLGINKTYAGLTKDQIVTDPQKLVDLDNLRDHVANQHEPGYTAPPAADLNRLLQSAHDVTKQTGIDFVNGSNVEKFDKITNFLEQNKQAMQEYQERNLMNNQVGAVGNNDKFSNAQSPEDVAKILGDNPTKPEITAAKGRLAELNAEKKIDRTKLSGIALDKTNQELQGDKLTPEAYSSVFGVSKEQAAKDLAPKPEPITKPLPKEPITLSRAEKQDLIKNEPTQQTEHTVTLDVPKGNIKGGIAQAMGKADERLALFQKADQFGSKLSDNEKTQLGEVLNGQQKVPETASPTFKKAVDAYHQAYDLSLATDRAAGGNTLRWNQGKYAPLYLKATEEEMNKMGIDPEDRYTANGYSGFRDSSRQYRSYADAAKKGLEPLFGNAVEDAKHYAQSGDYPIRNNLLYTALKKAAPDQVAEIGYGVDANGKKFTQAAGRLPFNASDEMQGYLKNFKAPWEPSSRAGQISLNIAEKANALSKAVTFFLSPVHYANMESNFLGLTAGSGHGGLAASGTASAMRATTRAGYESLLDHYRQNGVLDYARNMGIELQGGSRMHRFSDALALKLAEAAKNHGVDATSEEGTKLGAEYNKVMGHTNAAVEGRSQNTLKLTRGTALAPQWSPTQIGLVKDAIVKTLTGQGKHGLGLYDSADVARSIVLGKRALEGSVATLVSAMIAGQMPSWSQVINRFGLNPSNPVPNIDTGTKDQKGRGQLLNLPTDPIGLTTGLVTDPKHFLQSRYSPGLALGTRIATNQNWNGQPLVDMNQPNAWPLRIAHAATGNLPISLQNATNPNLSVRQGLLQDIGLRYKSDPNDPQVAANTNYFNAIKQTGNDLKNSGQYGQYWAQQFNNLHPAKTTDASGTKYPTPYNPVSSEAKYAAYTTVDQNGNQILSPVFDADKKLANMTPDYPSSPLYKLEGTGTDVQGNEAPQALVALQYQHAQTPAQKAVIMDANGGQNGWLADYEKQVADYSKNYQSNLTNYFQNLGWSQKAIDDYWSKHPSTPDPVDQVSLDEPTTNLLNQYYSLSGSGDSTSAAKFFSQHADVLGPAFDQLAQHANALRAAKGELQEQGYPAEPENVKAVLSAMPQGADSASKKARAQIINSNPAVSQYLANVALYETISKGAQFQFKNPADMQATQGENINNGGAAGQSFLKNALSLGTYDIGKNPTTNQLSFMQNGGFPAGSSAGGKIAFGKSKGRNIYFKQKIHPGHAYHAKNTKKFALSVPSSKSISYKARSKSRIKLA